MARYHTYVQTTAGFRTVLNGMPPGFEPVIGI